MLGARHVDDGVVRDDGVEARVGKRQVTEVALHGTGAGHEVAGERELGGREVEADRLDVALDEMLHDGHTRAAAGVEDARPLRQAHEEAVEHRDVHAVVRPLRQVAVRDHVVPGAHDRSVVLGHPASLARGHTPPERITPPNSSGAGQGLAALRSGVAVAAGEGGAGVVLVVLVPGLDVVDRPVPGVEHLVRQPKGPGATEHR